jgi:LasA protease
MSTRNMLISPFLSTRNLSAIFMAVILTLSGCASPAPAGILSSTPTNESTPDRPAITLQPTRPAYNPGELVDYTAQTGDTLPALASHFNTTVAEIRIANPIIPQDATSMPPGMPMKIPIYYQPLWGSSYQIIPDSLFVYGPALQEFDTATFVDQHPGWLKFYTEYAAGAERTGAQIIDYVAINFSISPRILLALLEYQAGALSKTVTPDTTYILGYGGYSHNGLYLQLVAAANELNIAYYGWRAGSLRDFDLSDGRLERPDPWQNAATVSLRSYFSKKLSPTDYLVATEVPGIAKTWSEMFGDPWTNTAPHIPGSLQQPPFLLPFQQGKTWAYTGGPHTGWGQGLPLAAIDFAPGAETSGCILSAEWATAVADGIIVRDGEGIVVLDLDGDGDERTGWVIFYLHIAQDGRAPVGRHLKAGEPVGHPSCEGGQATGTHVHLARKYNGEWLPADSPIPFDMEGWIVHNGFSEYQGTLTRYNQTIIACTCSNFESQLTAGR